MLRERPVSQADIETYETDGVVCLRGVIPIEWIDRLRRAVDRALASGGPEDAGTFQLRHNLASQDPDVRAFVHEGPSARIARELMGSETSRYYFDQLFVKEPGVETPTPWHHDQPYWPVTGKQIISVWTPLDPVTKANSGLEYIKGSHLWGREFAPVPFTEQVPPGYVPPTENLLPNIDQHRNEYEFVCWDMQPGDCLVHQARAVHGASGNTTREHRRRALSVRWLGDDARYRAPAVQDPILADPTLRPGDRMESLRFPLVLV